MILGFSSPVAYCSTLKPAGAFGHTPSGRATSFGELPADSVANGSGRSATVTLRIFPGSSYRKSVKGGFGAGASNLAALGASVLAAGAAGAAFRPRDFR